MMRISSPPILPLVWFALLFFIVSAQGTRSQDTTTVGGYRAVPSVPGEVCTVSGKVLGSDGVALIVKGRRVPLDTSMVQEFLHNKEHYFATMQPRGALFAESVDAPSGTALGGVSLTWFLLGLYVLFGLLFGGLSSYAAVGKGLSPLTHFFTGFFFIFLGYIYVLSRSSDAREGEIPPGLAKVPLTSEPLPCPHCGNTNHPLAKRCAACGNQLNPGSLAEVDRVHH
jgi:hypothetical protein